MNNHPFERYGPHTIVEEESSKRAQEQRAAAGNPKEALVCHALRLGCLVPARGYLLLPTNHQGSKNVQDTNGVANWRVPNWFSTVQHGSAGRRMTAGPCNGRS